jgi:mono/diheme cytochrome c family protein
VRKPLKEVLGDTFTLLVLAGTLILGVRVFFIFHQAKVPPPDLAQEGRRLYTEYRCWYCHRLEGSGGFIGPNLDNVGFRRTPEWMAHHFRDPREVSPGTKMLNLRLEDKEVTALVSYMKSLKGYTFTPAAPQLFKKHCVACHQSPGLGPQSRMILLGEGAHRDRDFIRDYIKDPVQLNTKAGMKGYRGVLTDGQIEDLANYIYQLGR